MIRCNRMAGTVACVLTVCLAVVTIPAFATTKGLNQIVTPDIQPDGQLSISFQQQDPTIGNRNEFQAEQGLTKNFEIAVFQGTSPSEQIFNTELGLVANGPWLLSTGFLNWLTKGSAPQPFLEGGFYEGAAELIAGAIQVPVQEQGVGLSVRNTHQTQSLLGAAYHVSSHLLVQVDYQAGSGNYSTAGFTYSITPSLNFNPAIYVSNASPRKGYAYAVLTWSIQAFGHSAAGAAPPITPPASTKTPNGSGAPAPQTNPSTQSK